MTFKVTIEKQNDGSYIAYNNEGEGAVIIGTGQTGSRNQLPGHIGRRTGIQLRSLVAAGILRRAERQRSRTEARHKRIADEAVQGRTHIHIGFPAQENRRRHPQPRQRADPAETGLTPLAAAEGADRNPHTALRAVIPNMRRFRRRRAWSGRRQGRCGEGSWRGRRTRPSAPAG